ncbi:YlbF family regulator [Coprobacillus cateniformis]|uniref:YlbF family regulator n=1 Tax=Coprobacillus cateniformis TaxID=100884 RepID=UPI003219357C
MYKEIDELIEAICVDEIFQQYLQSEKKLHDEKIVLLLSRHQMLQEDYLRVKQYQNYMTSDDLKEQLKEVKKELFEYPQIQSYYQSYYALNDLLEKVTEIIFQGISDELSFHQLTL